MPYTSPPPFRPVTLRGFEPRVARPEGGNTPKRKRKKSNRRLTAVLAKIQPDSVAKIALITFTSREHVERALGAAVAASIFGARR